MWAQLRETSKPALTSSSTSPSSVKTNITASANAKAKNEKRALAATFNEHDTVAGHSINPLQSLEAERSSFAATLAGDAFDNDETETILDDSNGRHTVKSADPLDLDVLDARIEANKAFNRSTTSVKGDANGKGLIKRSKPKDPPKAEAKPEVASVAAIAPAVEGAASKDNPAAEDKPIKKRRNTGPRAKKDATNDNLTNSQEDTAMQIDASPSKDSRSGQLIAAIMGTNSISASERERLVVLACDALTKSDPMAAYWDLEYTHTEQKLELLKSLLLRSR
jgi:hypothetical protein